jgi:hypothetical protein
VTDDGADTGPLQGIGDEIFADYFSPVRGGIFVEPNREEFLAPSGAARVNHRIFVSRISRGSRLKHNREIRQPRERGADAAPTELGIWGANELQRCRA